LWTARIDRYLNQVAEHRGQGTLDGVLVKGERSVTVADPREKSDPQLFLEELRKKWAAVEVPGAGIRDIPRPEHGKRSLTPASSRDVAPFDLFR
jgi:hypothetical protein